MSASTPKVDSRTAADISEQLVDLIEQYTDVPGGFFPQWKEYDAATREPTGVSAALIGIFARFAELVIQRLNQVPDKSFRAFLDMLGASQLPPEPARVPLTFSLAAGRIGEAQVPAGTKVAAQLAEGEKEPVIFEVEQPLMVTAAQLVSIVTLDPEQDTTADSSSAGLVDSLPFRVFQGKNSVSHEFYVGDDRLFGYSWIKQVRLNFTLAPQSTPEDVRELLWERWNGQEWAATDLPILEDLTDQLSTAGTLRLDELPPLQQSVVNSRTSRWLRCRLVTPITLASEHLEGMVRAAELPSITGIEVAVDVERPTTSGLDAEMGFVNGVTLDLTKPFHPFGERPKLHDTFYLASREAFSKDPTATNAGASAEVTLKVELANPVSADPGSVKPSSDLELVWECSTSSGWVVVGRSTSTNSAPSNAPAGFSDLSYGLTKTGDVKLRLPDTFATATVNGHESHWLRVRVVKGNYGEDGKYLPKSEDYQDGFYFIPATYSPPIISQLKLGYKFTAHRAPEACFTYNYLAFQDVTSGAAGVAPGFAPFSSGPEQQKPGISLGFELPARQTRFPNTPVSLYASLAAPKYGGRSVPLWPDVSIETGTSGATVTHHFVVTNTSAQSQSFGMMALGHCWATVLAGEDPLVPQQFVVGPGEAQEFSLQVSIPQGTQTGTVDRCFLRLWADEEPSVVHTACFTTAAGLQPSPVTPRLVWQYWNGSGWQKLAVRDGSEGFTRSGLVEFLAPSDFAVHELFGRKRYWLRALWQEGDYSVSPRLRQLVLNTTLAVQSQTFLNEILGSSTGSEDQVFRSTRSPVLEGQRLEVREPELPGAGEQALLKKEEGDDAISVVTDAAGRPREIWVRWHEVPDFYGSGPRDRHYVMDHLTGEIRFGDGISGRIPPIGAGNLRLARYQSGGGAIANRAAGTVTQLKTTVPYIEKVTNPEAAAGGAEAEPIEALYERMPRTLRHRDRAVTLEDYEDLAALASSEVARTLCVPLRDLAADPLGDSPRYGMVSVIVVPRTSDAKPQPTLELLSRVQSFLEERAPADAGLAVVGPLYVRVDVHVELAVGSISEASTVERAVRERLDGFLHPLTGGLDAKGWDFGRAPHRSDFLALVEGIPGVDHVRFLKIDETEDLEAVRRTGRFLVYSGQHQINLVFDEA